LDAIAVAIRGWVVTLDAAFVGIAFDRGRPTLIAVAMVVTVFLGLLDARYRGTQLSHAARSRAIERKLVPGYQFAEFRRRAAKNQTQRFRLGGYETVIIFYVLLLVVLSLTWRVA
jgi:hypothetical protein